MNNNIGLQPGAVPYQFQALSGLPSTFEMQTPLFAPQQAPGQQHCACSPEGSKYQGIAQLVQVVVELVRTLVSAFSGGADSTQQATSMLAYPSINQSVSVDAGVNTTSADADNKPSSLNRVLDVGKVIWDYGKTAASYIGTAAKGAWGLAGRAYAGIKGALSSVGSWLGSLF